MTDQDLQGGVSDSGYRRMVDAILDSEVIMVSPDGRILTWNEGAARLKGCPAEEAVGRHISLFYTEEDRASRLAERELAEAARVGRFESQGWRVRKGGERFLANIVIQPIFGPDRALQGYVKVTRDVTVQVERERLLGRQQEEILALSTPVLQIWDGVLALPLIGAFDAVRSAKVTESLLQRVVDMAASVVILDVSGASAVDTAAVQQLFRIIAGVRLVGAETIICGVRPDTAQSVVHLGVDLAGVHSRGTLNAALHLAIDLVTKTKR